MDTHIPIYPTPDGSAMMARLPGEPGMPRGPEPTPSSERSVPDPPSAALVPPGPIKARRRGHPLLAGVGLTALVVAASGGFLVSRYNHVYPVPRMVAAVRTMAAEANIPPSSLLAPSASLAKIDVKPPPAAVRQTYVAMPKQAELQQVLGFGAVAPPGLAPVAKLPDTGPAKPSPAELAQNQEGAREGARRSSADTSGSGAGDSRPGGALPVEAEQGSAANAIAASSGVVAPAASSSAAPAGYVPREPGSDAATPFAAAPAAAAPGAAMAAGGGAAPEPGTWSAASGNARGRTASATPTPASAPPPAPAASSAGPAVSVSAIVAADPVKAAMELRPAPMSESRMVDVANLVTLIGTQMADLVRQDTQLRADFEKRSADMAKRLGDLELRMSMAEARKAVAGVATAQKAEAAAASAPAPAPSRTPPIVLTSAASVPGGTALTPRYRVQAASPGVALLAQVDRGGGDGAQLQVNVGDTIPGYGRVKSIGQRGTSWVVSTEHGAIQ